MTLLPFGANSEMSREKKKPMWTAADGEIMVPPRNPALSSLQSLTDDDLSVVFQPIVALETGKTFGLEALVRCRFPEYANPPRLFEQAENERTCGRLGRRIREIAFELCPDETLFVNIHPAELSSRWLVRPDDPICFHQRQVFLEITESATFDYFDVCLNALKEVCSRTGAKLVIDDLGAGYSNFQRIADLHPSIVKLDLALAKDVDKNPRQRTLIVQLVNLCVALGAKVVLEGIETADQLRAARDAGVHYGQGYYLARPGFPIPSVNWPMG